MEVVRLCLVLLCLPALVISAPRAGEHTCAGSAQASRGRPHTEAVHELPCGVTKYLQNRSHSLRIANGRLVRPGELPFLAHFDERYCVATILDEYHLLTSANCEDVRDKNNLIVYIGCHKGKDACIAKKISKTIVHENYTIFTQVGDIRSDAYDIALLRTETPMEFKLTESGLGSVNKICLPNRDDGYEPGDPVSIAGWGPPYNYTTTPWTETPNEPGLAEMIFLEHEQCAKKVQEVGFPYLAGKLLCVVDPDPTKCCRKVKSNCLGDRGGPLLGLKGGKYEVLGIFSYSQGCFPNLFPNVFTRISSFIDWIEWAKKEMNK